MHRMNSGRHKSLKLIACLRRFGADAEGDGDLIALVALRNETQNVHLTGGQQRGSRLELDTGKGAFGRGDLADRG